MTATMGHGLPMTYFKVAGGGAQLTLNAIPRVWRNEGATVGFTVNGHDYVAYAPTGASWNVAGSAVTSGLAGKAYYTVAVLPTTAGQHRQRAGRIGRAVRCLRLCHGDRFEESATGTTRQAAPSPPPTDSPRSRRRGPKPEPSRPCTNTNGSP